MSHPETATEPPQRVRAQEFNKNKPRFIDINEVSYRTGLGRSTIWAKARNGDFVQPIKIKAGVTRWLESDIDEWIAGLLATAQR